MLAVVHHHQHPAIADGADDTVVRRSAGLVGQTDCTGDRDRHHLRMRDRRQVDVVHAVWEGAADAARDLDGQPCLARTTCTGQVHQPVAFQQPSHLVHLCAAADEAGERRRKAGRINAFRGPQRGKFVARIGVAQLHNPLGPRQIAQLVRAQLRQPRIGGQVVDDQRLRRPRQQRLTAVSEVAQARRPVDRRARIVTLVTQLYLAGVHPDAAAGSEPAAPAAVPARTPRRHWRGRRPPRSCRPRPARPGRTPPWDVTNSSTTELSRPSAAAISSAWVSHSRVEPSTSASSSVTVPVGSSFTCRSLHASGALMLASMRSRAAENIRESPYMSSFGAQ